MKIVYVDMCADLFHYGHVEFLRRAKNYGDKLFVGIHNDATIQSYKRQPILSMDARIRVVEACRYVNKVIPDAPLFITKEYIDRHGINLIVTCERTREEIEQMYKIPYELGILTQIPYTYGISTTEIIKRIKERE